MLDLIHQGGAGSWPVILFAAIALVTAGLFCWRPDGRRLAYLRGMTTATLFAILAAVASNGAAVLHRVSEDPAASPGMLTGGLAESLAPAILGFVVLGLCWFLTAFGLRRLESP